MNKEIYKSDRYYTFYDFQVSHGQLLLRSDKRKGYDNNIDIVFFGVSYIQLFTKLDGIVIRVADKTLVADYNSVSKYLTYEGENLFEIESNSEKYYLAASFARVFENQLESYETSLGIDEKGREKELANSFTDT